MIDVLLALASAWTVTKQPDPITDRMNVTATLRGDNANIVFFCAKSGVPQLLYRPTAFLRDDPRERRRPITYRFDEQAPQTVRWVYRYEYAEPGKKGAAAEFARWMIGSSSLTIRAERYNRQLVDSTFDLTGAGPALNEVFEACGITT